MPMFINDADDWFNQICSEVFNRLNAVGHGKFRAKNP